MNENASAAVARPTDERAVQKPQLWHVVLLDDDDHTYDYVIDLCQDIFGLTQQRGYQLAQMVDVKGRAICKTTHRELAELKVEQIRAYGGDYRMAGSNHSMAAMLVPADDEGDENNSGPNDGRDEYSG